MSERGSEKRNKKRENWGKRKFGEKYRVQKRRVMMTVISFVGVFC